MGSRVLPETYWGHMRTRNDGKQCIKQVTYIDLTKDRSLARRALSFNLLSVHPSKTRCAHHKSSSCKVVPPNYRCCISTIDCKSTWQATWGTHPENRLYISRNFPILPPLYSCGTAILPASSILEHVERSPPFREMRDSTNKSR